MSIPKTYLFLFAISATAQTLVSPSQTDLRSMSARWFAHCGQGTRMWSADGGTRIDALQVAGYGADLSADGSRLTLHRPRLAPVVVTIPPSALNGVLFVAWAGVVPNISASGIGFGVSGVAWVRGLPSGQPAIEVQVRAGRFTRIDARPMASACAQW